MNFFHFKYCFLLVIVAISSKTVAQQYHFVGYSTEEGLAQSQVYDLVQDKHYNIWVATLDGLSKFNGKSFKNFYKDQGLNSNSIECLFNDIENRIWVGTDNGVNIIINDSVFDLKIDAIKNEKINDIYIKDSSVFIIHSNSQIHILHFKDFKNLDLTRLTQENYEIKGRKRARSIFVDKALIYISTSRGLYEIANNKIQLSSLVDSNTNCNLIKKDLIGNLWLATLQNGIYKINQKKQITHYTRENEFNILNNYVRDLIIDHQNNIWSCSKSGVTKISASNVVTNFGTSNGFDYVAEIIFEDAEGNIWIGTEGKGILKFVNEAFSSLTTKQGLNSDLILSFSEDNEQNIWFSSYGKGICRLNPNGEFTSFNVTNSNLPNNTVWSSFKDSNDNLWFGTTGGAALYKDNSFIIFDDNSGLPDNKVQSFYGENGVIWVGTKNGLALIENETIKKTYPLRYGNIRRILKYNEQLILASSMGVLKLNTADSSMISFVKKVDQKTIYCLEKFQNQLWIGTEDGLYLYNGDSAKKVKFSSINSNSSSINFLHIDKQNNLWVGANSGVYFKNLSDNDSLFKFLNKEDGLIGVETNLGAIFEDSKNQIWFGTSEGVSIFNPKNETIGKDFHLKISINEVKLFYETKNWVTRKNEQFRYNQNHFTFYFNAPYFKKPSAVSYSYILKGFNENWSPPDKNNFVRYPNISPGEYTFLVKASTDLINWSEPVSHTFTIKAPFWLTWWFRIGVLILVFSFIYWLFLRQRKRQKEKRKADILVYKNKLVKLEQQSLNASMNRHFIFNALNSIQFYINKEDKLSANRYLSSFAKLIRKNLDSSVNEDNLISLEEELERLKLYLSLEKMRFKDRFEYEINIDPNVDLEMNKVPGMFLQPFVENSIWHGILPSQKLGLITLSIKKQGEGFQFTIEDNGIGIETSKKLKESSANNHISRGMLIASNRIAMLEKITGKDIILTGPYEIKKEGKVKGTRVEVFFN